MAECMEFPDTVEEFMENNKIVDTEEVYTNGVEMVPIFRMMQWFQHRPERKKGKWDCSDDIYETAICSVCGWDTTDPWDHIRHWFNFCPNCGADMRGGET